MHVNPFAAKFYRKLHEAVCYTVIPTEYTLKSYDSVESASTVNIFPGGKR